MAVTYTEIPYEPLPATFPAAPSCLLHTARTTPRDRWSIVGWDPAAVYSLFAPIDPLAWMDAYLAAEQAQESPAAHAEYSALPFPLPRLMGLLTYDAGRAVVATPSTARDIWHRWLGTWLMCRRFWMADHQTLRSWQVHWPRDAVPDVMGVVPTGAALVPPMESEWQHLSSENFSRAQYLETVEQIRAMIMAGDCYQVNLSRQVHRRTAKSAQDIFRTLVADNPAPMMGLLDLGSLQVVSSSPERLLAKAGRQLHSCPIKGTRPRAASAHEDRALQQQLWHDPKEQAELAMIVDLVRNDLGKVALPGSVRVTCPRTIESYTNVHHAVATIAAQARPDATWGQLLRAVFPGGSITGCPKEQAMAVIEACEGVGRGPYCGSLGYIDVAGNGDWNIAIRTVTVCGGAACFNVGGGIVYDSIPAAEYEETIAKGRSIAQAV